MIRVGSISDELMNMNSLNSDLFQRMGVFAAFNSWERAKRLIYFK